MRRALVSLLVGILSVAVLGLTATGFAGSSISSSEAQYGGPGHAGGPAQDSVYGGGRYGGALTDGNPFFVSLREFSLDAHANPTGGGAYGSVTIGNPANGNRTLGGEVTCLSVEGNVAVVGGFIRENVDPNAVGRAFFLFVKDFGLAGSGTLDRGSATFMDLPDSPDLPEGFPRQCDLVDTNAFGFGYVPFTAGDIVIHDE